MKSIKKAKEIGVNLKGVITVGLFGQPSDMDKVKEIAALNNLWVFDDAAQSLMVPVSKLRGILPSNSGADGTAADELTLFFESTNNSLQLSLINLVAE